MARDINKHQLVNTFNKQILKLFKKKNDGPERW